MNTKLSQTIIKVERFTHKLNFHKYELTKKFRNKIYENQRQNQNSDRKSFKST